MSDDRRLTLIMVPHGDLETRRFEVSYRRLKVLVGAALLFIIIFVGMAGSWWYVASRAARVPELERTVARLKVQRAQVADLARTLEQVEAQYAHVRQLLGADEAPEGGMAWLPPLRPGGGLAEAAPAAGERPVTWPLTQAGYITREVTSGDGRHPGLDIAVPRDSYIRAAGSGIVRDAGTDEVYGRYVVIDHGDGLESLYAHASRLFVGVGERVASGEVIALSGSSGRSTAPHLHFEIHDSGEIVDPLEFVTQPQ